MARDNSILILSLNYAPEATGIAPYAAALARGLNQLGHEIRVLTAHPHYPQWRVSAGYGGWTRTEVLDGVPVTRLRHYVPKKPTPVPRAASEASFGLRQVIRRWGHPDAIVALSPALVASALVRLRAKVTHPRTPFVVWVQDLYGVGVQETGQGSSGANQLVATLERWLLRSASRVVVIHDRFADRVHADFGIERSRIEVVRNWTHLPTFPSVDRVAVRAKHGWSEDEIVVLHSGNMGVKQGLHHVVESARLAHARGLGVRFVLLGSGSQRADLERLAAEEPASIQFIDSLDDADFAAALQAADILLVNELPGVAEMAVPSKLTSYFAAGRPVLAATDSSGITAQEVESAGAGIVVRAGDAEAILGGAQTLASDSAAAAAMGTSGRRYRETVLDESVAIDRFDRLLTSLVGPVREAGITTTPLDDHLQEDSH